MPLKPLCELIVSRIIPAFRASLVKNLMEEYGLNQTEVSNLLCISQPAVSQYRSETRGNIEEIHSLFPDIKGYISDISEKIVEKEMTAEDVNFCIPCRSIQKSDDFCELHKDYSALSSGCAICDEREG